MVYFIIYLLNHRNVFNKHSTFIRFWWETRQSSKYNHYFTNSFTNMCKIPFFFLCMLTGITWKWHQSRFSGCHWCNSASLSDTTMWQWYHNIYNININVENNVTCCAIVLSINYYYSSSSNGLFQKINTMRIWKVSSPLWDMPSHTISSHLILSLQDRCMTGRNPQ